MCATAKKIVHYVCVLHVDETSDACEALALGIQGTLGLKIQGAFRRAFLASAFSKKRLSFVVTRFSKRFFGKRDLRAETSFAKKLFEMFGVKGFEPLHVGIKNRCLSTWLYSIVFLCLGACTHVRMFLPVCKNI